MDPTTPVSPLNQVPDSAGYQQNDQSLITQTSEEASSVGTNTDYQSQQYAENPSTTDSSDTNDSLVPEGITTESAQPTTPQITSIPTVDSQQVDPSVISQATVNDSNTTTPSSQDPTPQPQYSSASEQQPVQPAPVLQSSTENSQPDHHQVVAASTGPINDIIANPSMAHTTPGGGETASSTAPDPSSDKLAQKLPHKKSNMPVIVGVVLLVIILVLIVVAYTTSR